MKKHFFAITLGASFVASFISYFLENLKLVMTFLWLYAAIVLCYFIVNAVKKRIKYAFITFFTLLSLAFQFFHWGYFYEIRYAMIIPIVTYFSLFFNWKKHKPHLLTLFFVVTYQLMEFSTIVRIWLSNNL